MTTLIIRSNDLDNPTVVYPYDPDEISEFSALKDALYIWWELTPFFRGWSEVLRFPGDKVEFVYGETDFCPVERINANEYRVVL